MHQVSHDPAPPANDEALASLLAMIRDAIEDNRAQQIATAAIARSLTAGLTELRRTEARLVACMAPAEHLWEDTTVSDLRLGDVIRWPGSHVQTETIHGCGNAGFGRRYIATDYVATDYDGCDPVKVRLPRPSDTTGLELVESARSEMAAV